MSRFLILFFVLSTLTLSAKTKLPSFYDNKAHEILAQELCNAMKPEELLAQNFMFGWAGQNPRGLLSEWIDTVGLGSVKVFGRNTSDSIQLAKAITFLQKKAAARRFSIPLFIATDQEGGWIRHVKGLTSDTSGNLAIGATALPYDAFYSGYYIGKELRALGINLNFAPTIDLYSNYDSTIIGPRSFGESPTLVSSLGVAFMKGLQTAGVMPTAKHFPGHGDTKLDSHGFLPEINISKEQLYNRELIPFKALIDAGVPAIMCGHLGFPAIIPNKAPTTFSPFMLNTILRKELKFKGLIITDDMMMKAAIDYAGSIAQAVQQALVAGNNIIESSSTPHFYEAFWKDTLQRLKTDPHFYAQVKNSAYRIILAKLHYFKGRNPVPLYPAIELIPEQIPDPQATAFFLALAARSVTVLRTKDLPYKTKSQDKVLLVANYADFFKAGTARFPNAEHASLQNNLLYKVADFDVIIYCVAEKNETMLLKELIKRYPQKRIFVLSALSPVHLALVPEACNVLALYSYSLPAFKAGFAALCGDFRPRGKLPIKNLQ